MTIKIKKSEADKIAKENGFKDAIALLQYLDDKPRKKYNFYNLRHILFVKFIVFCHLKDSDLINLVLEVKNDGAENLSEQFN